MASECTNGLARRKPHGCRTERQRTLRYPTLHGIGLQTAISAEAYMKSCRLLPY